MIKYQTEKIKAFTLLETLIAVTVLLISIIGPMTIASKGLSSAIYARDEITAFYLAQEALEYVRMQRDSNTLAACYGANPSGCYNEDEWLDGLEDYCVSVGTPSKTCYIDVVEGDVLPSDPGRLKFNTANNTYSYASGDLSKFSRSVNITEDSGHTYAKVEVSVTWPAGALLNTDKTFKITDYITNSQRNRN